MNFRKLLTALFAAAVSSPVLPAGEFTPANMFGTGLFGQDVVAEVDREGNTLREFGSGELDGPVELAFGPGGLLYVGSGGDRRIKVFNADGVLVRQFDAGVQGVFHLEFGPDGHLFVASFGQTITEFTPQGGFVRSFNPPSGSVTGGLAIGHDGLIYSGSSSGTINVFTRSGDWIRAISLPENFADFCMGPNGNLFGFLSSSHHLLELRLDGSVAGSFGAQSNIGTITRLAFGPDQHLYVNASVSSAKLFVFDLDGNQVKVIDDMWLGTVAFAPYRFKAGIKATVVRPGTGLVKVKEQRAVLSIHPGTGVAMLDLLDDPSKPLDLASLLNTTALLFHGISPDAGHPKKRLLDGTQASPGTHTADSASLTLELKGKTGADGVYGVKQAKGTLHARMGHTVLTGTLKTTRLLKS